MALSLTPALCATLLKPVEAGHHHEKTRLLRLVQPRLHAHRQGLRRLGRAHAAAAPARYLVIYAAIIGAVVLRVTRACRPPSCRSEDQGNIIVNVQLPPGATQERTLRRDGAGRGLHPQAARSAEHGRRAGLQLLGPGPERGAGLRDAEGLERAQGRRPLGRGAGRPRLRRAVGRARCLHLPAAARRRFPNWARPRGFTFRLQDRGGAGHDALLARAQPAAGHGRRRARSWRRCGPTAWKTRRSCRSTSTATRPTRWA